MSVWNELLADGEVCEVRPTEIQDQISETTWRRVTAVSDPTWDERALGLESYLAVADSDSTWTFPDGRTVVVKQGDRRLILPDDAKITITDTGNSLGGGAANVAVALSRMGIPVDLVGHVGDDDHGEDILQALRALSVGTDSIRVVQGGKSRRSNIFPLSGKARLILAKRYVDVKSFTTEDLHLPDNPGGVGYLSGQRNITNLNYLVDKLKAGGVTTIAINPSGEELAQTADMRRIMNQIELLTANKEELLGFAAGLPHPADGTDSLLTTLRRIQENLDEGGVLVMTDGAKGSVALDANHAVASGIYQMHDEMENMPGGLRLGSGDGAAAGWVMNLAATDARTLPPDEFLRRGMFLASYNSALVCTAFGASERTLRPSEIDLAHTMEMLQQQFKS
jgi:sugar/nucleoside kinase (ribokinase family)